MFLNFRVCTNTLMVKLDYFIFFLMIITGTMYIVSAIIRPNGKKINKCKSGRCAILPVYSLIVLNVPNGLMLTRHQKLTYKELQT